MPALDLVSRGIPVVTERMFTNALSPRLDASGWDFICQLYNYPDNNPAEWVVVNLETGAYQRFYDTPYTPGTRGRYANANFTYLNQLRAPNGRIYFPAVDAWLWCYDPATRAILDLGNTQGPPYDTTLYSMRFNTDGTRIYGGTIGNISTDPHMLPMALYVTPATNAITALCRVGSSGHTLQAYAYSEHADGAGVDGFAYYLVGQDIWDVVIVNTVAKTQTIVATATVNAWATFTEKPEGLVANLYTNYKLPSQTVQSWWLVDGVAYPYSEPYNPADLPFPPRNVTPYSNPLVNPPGLDLLFVPEAVGWRPSGSSAPYTYVPFTVLYAAPIPVESLVTLPTGDLLGSAQQYQGFFRYVPGSHAITWYGAGPGVTEGTARAVTADRVYISGYPNGVLFAYDWTQPWTQPPQGRLPSKNPSYLGGYSNGLSLSGIKHAEFLAYSAMTNRVYMVGLRDRSGFGGGIGYYDIAAKVFAGTFANLNYYQGDMGIVVFDGLGRVVIGGHIGADPETPVPPPASAELVLYDMALAEIARQIPIAGMQDTGRLFETGEASVVFGLSQVDKLAYRWDINTQTLLGSIDLSVYAGSIGASARDPSGLVVVPIGQALFEIDPVTLLVTELGTFTGGPLPAFAFAGGSTFTAIGAELFEIPAAAPVFHLAIDTAAIAVDAADVGLTPGTRGELALGTAAIALDASDISFSVSQDLSLDTLQVITRASEITFRYRSRAQRSAIVVYSNSAYPIRPFPIITNQR